MTNVREIVYEALILTDKDEQNNSFVKDIMDKYSYLDKQDRSFLGRLLEGTIERRITIDYVLNLYSKVPVNKMKPKVRALMREAVYQIMYMDSVPDSAAVNECVKLAKKRGFSSLSGFINGVLRNVARNKNNIEYPDRAENEAEFLSVYYSCPEWIVRKLISEQGIQNAENVLLNSVSVRPVMARVNTGRASVDELVKNSSGTLDKLDILDYAVRIHDVDSVTAMPEFLNGLITVQDVSSMLVCHVADIKAGNTVIDVCAAPGGKTMHAAQYATCGKVISCDVSDNKIARILENVQRCGYENVDAVCADATVFNRDFEGAADVLIADVPCSGLGVMGRKNDIKYKLREDGLTGLVTLQRDIIRNVIRYVKPGGTLMFSTCTVNKNENEDNVEFIRKCGFSSVDFYDDLPEQLRTDSAHNGYIQLYGENGVTDGFFIAKFVKEDANNG